MSQLRLFYCVLFYCFIYFNCNFYVSGQNPSTCPNSNFSQGNFTDWAGFYGDFINPAENQGMLPDRHTIIKAPGSYDINTGGGLFTIPPGELFSARLGSTTKGAEQLRYSILVTEETNLFIYKYAVVLEDPGHQANEQPNFTIEVFNNTGYLIDSVCGYYYVYAHQGLPSWHIGSSADVIWKDWTTVGINLSSYVGQIITIVFTTRDCYIGGHYGYAYISAYCSNLKIVYGSCPNDTIAYLTAPPGFSYKWDNGDTNQTISIHNPVLGMIDSCVLTSVNGCSVTIYGTFKTPTYNIDFATQAVCLGTPTTFTDLSTANQDQIINWKWDFGDSTDQVISIQNPTHIYDSYGIYNITLVTNSFNGCSDSVTKSVEVVRIPIADIEADYTCNLIDMKDTLFFDKQVQLTVPEGNDLYVWSTGEMTNSIIVTSEGWYTISIENAGLCRASDSVMMFECNVDMFMPNAFSPNNDGFNDFFRPVTIPEKVRIFNMLIYNQWGQKIYETNNVYQGWDGTINGESASLDSYTYILSYMNPNGNMRKLRGLFTLIR